MPIDEIAQARPNPLSGGDFLSLRREVIAKAPRAFYSRTARHLHKHTYSSAHTRIL